MGWIIAGIIFIIILVLLLGRVQITADYSEDFILKIKYMFFPILTLPSTKPKKEKKPKKPKNPPPDEFSLASSSRFLFFLHITKTDSFVQ